MDENKILSIAECVYDLPFKSWFERNPTSFVDTWGYLKG